MFRFLRPRIELKIQRELNKWELDSRDPEQVTRAIRWEVEAKTREAYRQAIEVEVDRQLIARLTEECMKEIDFEAVIKESMKEKLKQYLQRA